MFMMMFISKDVDQALDILEVWFKAGIEGVTIVESAGMQQLGKQGIPDDVGILFSLSSFMRRQEIHHRTLFSAVKDEATLQHAVEATTRYVGDWSKTDVGVLFVWPLSYAYGLDKGFNK